VVTLSPWGLVRFLHVLAAIGWVGGQLVLSGVVLPVLRRRLRPNLRVPIIRETALRFAAVANMALLPTLLVTGVALAAHRGMTLAGLGDPGYGRTLAIKLVFVALSVVLAGAHGSLAVRRPRQARPLAIAGLVSSVAIVVFATALVP
jgi:putative copper export protein